jgi:hypothetical protein
MISAKILENVNFNPITIELTIHSQQSLDKLTSLINCAAVCKVAPEINKALFDILTSNGGDQSIYVDKYIEAFQK